MRSWQIPSLSHQIERRESPPAPRLANGVPLSVRILSGSPRSRNAASNIGWTRTGFVERRAVHRSSMRLHASVIRFGHDCIRRDEPPPLACCLVEKVSRMGVASVLSNQEREEAARIDE